MFCVTLMSNIFCINCQYLTLCGVILSYMLSVWFQFLSICAFAKYYCKKTTNILMKFVVIVGWFF
jgi:hypothetical protein